MELTVLLAFVGTIFLVSVSPGLCMTLSMSLGIRVGLRKTLWMMLGELVGVALVTVAAILGIAALLMADPKVFAVFKCLGALYLFYMAWQAWQAEPATPEQMTTEITRSNFALISQGFLTAVSNPKAWAFFAALMPPFINQSAPLLPQMVSFLVLILIVEFICLLLYAQGGKALNRFLHKRGKAQWLNKISAALMFFVGLWLLWS